MNVFDVQCSFGVYGFLSPIVLVSLIELKMYSMGKMYFYYFVAPVSVDLNWLNGLDLSINTVYSFSIFVRTTMVVVSLF